MRILLLAPQVPWPMEQGTAIRNFHLARQLATRHEVTLVAFGSSPAPGNPLDQAGVQVVAVPPPPPRSLARRLAELVTLPTPDLARRLLSPAMGPTLAELAAVAHHHPFDIVQIEGLEMALHGLAAHRLLTAAGPRPRLIYDAHNAEWVLQHRAWLTDIRRWRGLAGAGYSLLQAIKLRRFERRLLAEVDATVAVSQADARALAALTPGARLRVVPNGVDLAAYRPADPGRAEPEQCVFVGKMDFRPNIDAVDWFCRTVWPGVRQARPGARLAIVGRDPVARVRRLAGESIQVTGTVPDVRPWLERAGVVVVPMRVGGGTRLKVLEAMAMAKAIVATSMAVEGLEVTAGSELLVADNPAEQTAAILRLMEEPATRLMLGRRARQRARQYDWAVVVPRLEALYGDDG